MTREEYRQRCQDESRRTFGKRDRAIYKRSKTEKLAAIARRYGLSRERVRVIVSRMAQEEQEA